MKHHISVEALTVGQMAANCYLIRDLASDQVLIIDPGEDAGYIAEHALANGGKPVALWATHGHFDHILGAGELMLTLSVPFLLHAEDRFLVSRMGETAAHFLKRPVPEPPPAISATLSSGTQRVVGEPLITIVETPGHTPGSVAFYLKDEGILFTGDTMFAGGAVGRTDFSYSQRDALWQSVGRLLALPDETVIYPGHGEPTTVKKEKEYHTIRT